MEDKEPEREPSTREEFLLDIMRSIAHYEEKAESLRKLVRGLLVKEDLGVGIRFFREGEIVLYETFEKKSGFKLPNGE